MSFAEFHFLRPWWFLALLPAVLILVLLFKHRQSRGNWSEVCDKDLLPFLLVDKPMPQQRGGLIAGGLVCLLTIIALAGPTWQRLPTPAFRNESALVIALDLSLSMDAADIKPSRLLKARYKIADLLKQRKDGQTALLVYGGDAFTVVPLTGDTATISSQLEALTTDIMPSPGRNTGAAIQKAVNLLRQAGLAQGHILLITDGVDAESAASFQQRLDAYRLSVLGIGTSEGAPVQQSGGGFVKDSKGGIVIARLDSQALSSLAQTGKGVYQTVTANDNDVETLSKVFNTLPGDGKTRDINLLLQQWDEKGVWLVLLILPWAALRFRRGLLIWVLFFLAPFPRESQALDWHGLWQNPNQQAQQAFKQQQYQQAAEQFDNPAWRAAAQYKAGEFEQAAETLKDAATADEFYNRGNALAQAGKLQEALQSYQQALKLDSKHADAQYNKDIVEKKLQDQQKQQNQDGQQAEQKSGEKSEQEKQQNQQADKSQPQNRQDQNNATQNQQEQQQGNQSEQPAQQDKQKSEETGQADKADANKQSAADAQQQKPDAAKDEKDKKAGQQQEAMTPEKAEIDRANEQLLKRIPDEPTGLLKRKFKYLYRQGGKKTADDTQW